MILITQYWFLRLSSYKGEILPPVKGQTIAKVTWTKTPFTTPADWVLNCPDLENSAFVSREAQNMQKWLLQSHPFLKGTKVTAHIYW